MKPHAEYVHYDTHYFIGKQIRLIIDDFRQPEVTVVFGNQELKINKVNAKDLIKVLQQAEEYL